MKEKKSTPEKDGSGARKETLEKITEQEREEYYRERRRQRKLLRQRQVRRRKMMILGATAVISLVVVVGAVRGITGFVAGRISEADKAETANQEQAEN